MTNKRIELLEFNFWQYPGYKPQKTHKLRENRITALFRFPNIIDSGKESQTNHNLSEWITKNYLLTQLGIKSQTFYSLNKRIITSSTWKADKQ